MQLNKKKLQDDLNASMKAVQGKEIQRALEEAERSIEQAQKDVAQNSDLKQEKMQEVQEALARALKDVDMKKIKAETETALAQVDVEKINAKIERIQQVDMQKMQRQLQQMEPKIQASIEKAHEDIEQAQKELTNYKNLIDALDKDGLIQKDDHYTIEYRKGELIINGTKQPDAIKERYRQFLNGKNFKLIKDVNGFNIKNDRRFD